MRRILGLLLCIIALDGPAYSAAPATTKPAVVTPTVPEMQFVVVRSTMASCEPDCPEWIEGQGQITAATPAKLNKILANKANRNLPILLNSNGGDIKAALDMGRTIRKYKMTTSIGRTIFPLCDPFGTAPCRPSVSNQTYRGIAMDYTAECMSACPLLLLGGAQRLVSPNAYLGLHQPIRVEKPYIDRYRETYRMENGRKVILSKKFVKRTILPTKQVVGVDAKIRPYLTSYIKEMNGSLAIIDEMQKAVPASINLIKESDVVALGLATGTDTMDVYSRSATCTVATAPSYCVLIK